MKQFIFYTDIHRYGCYEIDCQTFPWDNAYYLGDNVDLSCCAYQDVPKAQRLLAFYKEQFAGRYVSGNHELERPNQIVVGNVLMMHGDYIFWPKVQADAYRARKPGASWLQRFLTRVVIHNMLGRRSWSISRLARHRAWVAARKAKCDTIVLGHWHPRTLQDITYRGVRIVVLPRGRTEISL